MLAELQRMVSGSLNLIQGAHHSLLPDGLMDAPTDASELSPFGDAHSSATPPGRAQGGTQSLTINHISSEVDSLCAFR